MPRIAVSERCTGHGRCYSMAPNVLEDDDEGFVTLRNSSKMIPDDALPEAEAARLSCPEDAITVTTDSPSIRRQP